MINISNILPDSTYETLEKGKAAQIGEIRTWNGKKYKKQANGKWLEVSEHGMTKKHYEEKLERTRFNDQHGQSSTKEQSELGHIHTNIKKLSDKEHSDEEVGLKISDSGSEIGGKGEIKISQEDFAKNSKATGENKTKEGASQDGEKKLTSKSTFKEMDEFADEVFDNVKLWEAHTFDRYVPSGRIPRTEAVKALKRRKDFNSDKEWFNAMTKEFEEKTGMPFTQETQDEGEMGGEEKGKEENVETSKVELEKHAKAASDKALKQAAQSGNEVLRVAAKKELERRKIEHIDKKESENPFDKAMEE